MRGRLALVATAATLTLAACGGDDDGGSDDGGSATSAGDLTTQIEEICRESQSRSEELNQELGNTSLLSPAAVPFLERLLTIMDETIADYEQLEPPADQAETYDELVQTFEEARDTLADFTAAVDAGDIAEAQQLESETNLIGSDIESLLEELGAEECAATGDA